ncbi:MAG: protein-L-isoaspartate O-methyltransferase [Gammaproteobacteria bacterium]|nr:MAG: protein-L-isoaspartate O-methyltransferase [Gammaproteobacteria bacterium]
MCERLAERGIKNPAVLDTLMRVPRHLFVDEAIATRAYEDVALPIGEGQTISQPFVVARMTELLLADGPKQRVLEVGTGSGYQAAVLAELVDVVFTVERIQSLYLKAKARFRALDYRNVNVRHSDGSWGWRSQGPFDGIVVTAAPEHLPDALFEQLAPGGTIVAPVGSQYGNQQLTVITHTAAGFIETRSLDVRFVPFLSGKH